MEILVLDFGKGVNKEKRAIHDISKIFDHGYSYEFDNAAHGWGMGHVASNAEIIKIGSMNDGKITIVERNEKHIINEFFTKYSTTQKQFNLSDLNVNQGGSGFFYHFYFKKNPWSPGSKRFSQIHPNNIFGTMEKSTQSLFYSGELYNALKNDEVTIQFQETDWKKYTAIYYGTLINPLNKNNLNNPIHIKITKDDSYDKNVPETIIGDSIFINHDEIELISTSKGQVSTINNNFDLAAFVNSHPTNIGDELRFVLNRQAKNIIYTGIVLELPSYKNNFVFKFSDLEISPDRINSFVIHKRNISSVNLELRNESA